MVDMDPDLHLREVVVATAARRCSTFLVNMKRNHLPLVVL